MDNPKTLASLGTQDTEETIRNGQSKDTGIIGHPRDRRNNKEWTIQRHWHHWAPKTQKRAIRNGQSKDTGIIGHPRHRTKRSKTHKNTTQKTKTMNNTYLTKKTGGNQVGNFWLL